MNDLEHKIHLHPRAYTLIGVALLALGLSISWVNGSFYIVGLGRIEPDAEVRELRAAFGILAVVAHLAFFFAASLLRHDRFQRARRMLTACALALLLLEIVTVYVTKVVLARSAEVAATSTDSRVQQLQEQIAASRRAAESLRLAGEKSGRSWIADSRADGARSLREAAEIEARTAPLVAELARAQSERRPTVIGVIGADGVQLFSAASAVVFILAGVAAVSVGGLLVGIARSHAAAARAAAPATAAKKAEAAPPYSSAARRWAAAGVPAAAIPAVAFAAPTVTVTAPAWPEAPTGHGVLTVTNSSQSQEVVKAAPAPLQSQPAGESVTVSSQSATDSAAAAESRTRRRVTKPRAAAVEVGHKRDSGVGAEDGYRYRRIRAAVQAGHLTPSVRAIQAAEGGGTAIVRAYLQEMEREGVIQRGGRGYQLARPAAAAGQMDLIG